MQSSIHTAEALRACSVYILQLEDMLVKLQSLLNSSEITDSARARLQTVLAETQDELKGLP